MNSPEVLSDSQTAANNLILNVGETGLVRLIQQDFDIQVRATYPYCRSLWCSRLDKSHFHRRNCLSFYLSLTLGD